MNAPYRISTTVLIPAFVLLSGCANSSVYPTLVPKPEAYVGLANPSAVYCEEQGFTYEIREDASGNAYGVCLFGDGQECDGWAFFRGECGPLEQPTSEAPLTPEPQVVSDESTPEASAESLAEISDVSEDPKEAEGDGELPTVAELPAVGKKWKPYRNNVFGYRLTLPPQAETTGFAVEIVPGDEVPEDRSADQYYTSLRKKYGKKLCVLIELGSGYIAISGPPNRGEKYTVCGRPDAEVLPLASLVEFVQVGDAVYQARGFIPDAENMSLTTQAEVFWIEFEDDTVIEFGTREGATAAYEAYLQNVKPTLLRILTTYK